MRSTHIFHPTFGAKIHIFLKTPARNEVFFGIFGINKQLNVPQEELGKLKSDARRYASLNKDALRDWHEMVLGDLD